MTYSIYLEQKGVTGPIPKPLNLWSLNEVDVEDLLQAINERHESVKIYGTVYEINDFKSINIFTEENQVSQESLRQHFKPWGSDDGYIAISGFMLLGRNVTTQFTNGVVPWGKTITSDYISSSTIRELRVISSSKYDLKKLVRLCEEINFNWKRKNYYSVAALIRAVLDHIPPIFDQPNFDSVVSQSKKTFKEIVSRLNELRDPANIHLHSQCSSSVSLAVEQDVDKRSDISMLLSKTIEQLKKDL